MAYYIPSPSSNVPPHLPTPMMIPTVEAVPINNGTTSVFNNNNPEEIPFNQRDRSSRMNKNQLTQLTEQGYTLGLATSLDDAKDVFVKRIWIIDNSGSMQQEDGHRIIETRKRNQVKMVSCSRWDEICECIHYHIELVKTIGAPTSFRLLNNPGINVGPQRFEVATTPTHAAYEAQEAMKIMRKARPGGCTPLTNHILDVQREISIMAPQLQQTGKRVAIVIATDGLPTDTRGYGGKSLQNEFVESLRLLEGLPVWVVIRLCTDEDEVVAFYNELDSVLELSIEVLDDFCGEAQEVYSTNPWLNYALPLHRMREMGYHDRVFDMLDERKLTKNELRDFCSLLFGEENFDGAPDPLVEWTEFVTFIQTLLRKEKLQWDPIKKKMRPWIDISYLNYMYGESTCTIL